jgi:hypothetical protein
MSLLSSVEGWLSTSEAFVMSLIVKIETGVQVVETDIETAWTWLAAHAGEISSDAAMVATGIQTLQSAGIPIPSAATTAIQEMNVAVTTLNAAVGASNAGANALGIVVAGYTAAKTAQANVATAASAISSVVPAPVTSAANLQGSGA